MIGDKAGKATFVEVCSDKGAGILDQAVKAGALKTEPADPKGVEMRGKVENAMLKLGDKWREKDFASLGTGRERLKKILADTSRCIKCYSCIENCPICYCVECSTKKPHFVTPGQVPPSFMFHLIRFAHIADSCINCGQCQELCAMDIPNSLHMHAQQVELEKMFGHVPGVDMKLPLLALVEEREERDRLAATGSDQIFNIFK
ncbi:MAG: Formate dehydrogenase subunit beta [Methanoregulaceae archaeon PtaB.Bin152]|nr:MAG: Formate dehydrogenase subunit beta [Methanoregulaceae archaeon PtaB.Bin152]